MQDPILNLNTRIKKKKKAFLDQEFHLLEGKTIWTDKSRGFKEILAPWHEALPAPVGWCGIFCGGVLQGGHTADKLVT